MKPDQLHFQNAAQTMRTMLQAQDREFPAQGNDIISYVAELAVALFGNFQDESTGEAQSYQRQTANLTVTEKCLAARGKKPTPQGTDNSLTATERCIRARQQFTT